MKVRPIRSAADRAQDVPRRGGPPAMRIEDPVTLSLQPSLEPVERGRALLGCDGVADLLDDNAQVIAAAGILERLLRRGDGDLGAGIRAVGILGAADDEQRTIGK